MSKVRSDSTWSGVAADRMEMLDKWLFEENLCYREVKEKIKTEWGMEVSTSSVGRYYRDREQEVALGDVADLQETADAVEAAPAKLERLRSSAWKMIGVRLLERTLRRGNVKELAMLGRLMSESEWREIQRGRLELAREKFEFNATKAAMEQMEKVTDEDRDEQAREELKARRISGHLFGRKRRRCAEVINPRMEPKGDIVRHQVGHGPDEQCPGTEDGHVVETPNAKGQNSI